MHGVWGGVAPCFEFGASDLGAYPAREANQIHGLLSTWEQLRRIKVYLLSTWEQLRRIIVYRR